MTCHDAREQFSALIDEILSREARADVYAHLATCPECRRELTALERTVALVRGATPMHAPASFVDAVMAATRPPWYVRAARAALLPWPVKLPLEAAAVLLVAGLAMLMFRGTADQQRAIHEGAPPAVLADRPPTPEPEPPAPAAADTEAKQVAPPAPAGGRADVNVSESAEAQRASTPSGEAVASRIEQAPKTPTPTAERDAAAPPVAESRQKIGALKREVAPHSLSAAAAADVVARLSTGDADTTARELAALAGRLGGSETGRLSASGGVVVNLTIPQARYAEFTREAARLGDYRAESEPSPLPETVRIAVRLAR
ncbi:MAG TPA: anti-sigma factor [Methylomirabilota bacterium]|nr:anti-sigma factor [Methylomirabilota bacterium]